MNKKSWQAGFQFTWGYSAYWKWSCRIIATNSGCISSLSLCFHISPLACTSHDIWGDNDAYVSANVKGYFISWIDLKFPSQGKSNLPAIGGGSGSLVLCKTIVPDSTVTNPQSTETMLLALWPAQSWNTNWKHINIKEKESLQRKKSTIKVP